MSRFRLHHALAAIVSAVAVLNTLSALSMPVPDRKPGLVVVVLWFVLLATHAGVYRFGERIRQRLGLRGYVILQAAVIFAIAVSRPPTPVTMGLFMAATVELVILAGARWGTIQITLGAIALFVLASLLTSDLYRATTAGLLLAVTGLIAHAVAALLHQPASAEGPRTPPADAQVPANGSAGLSVRETEVLRELVRGSRNSDIATKLSITERTVKSHLGSIYQKLGVESRSAAVAAAVQRKLV